MQPKPLGDLRYKSRSFSDFLESARNKRDWVLEKAVDQILGKALPEGTPSDLEDMLQDHAKFFMIWIEASIMSSLWVRSFRGSVGAQKLAQLAQKVPSLAQVLNTMARNGAYESLRRMCLVADANNLNLEHSSMRLVDSNLTPYQAQSQSVWNGTFAEFRTGSIMTGPADPRGHFAIYLPGERRKLQGSFVVTCITCEFQ